MEWVWLVTVVGGACSTVVSAACTMKVLILAAGYGTRFARDLESHKDEYPHLVGVAKPLLPVAGQPLISQWMDTLQSCDQTKDCEVYVVVRKLICYIIKQCI